MKRILSLFLCAVLLTASLTLPTFGADSVTVEGGTIENLGIPTLPQFPNGTGSGNRMYSRTVWGMEAFDGRIYIGCGDYNLNSGSAIGGLPVYAYTPATKTWKREGTVADEQISRFFTVGDRLYIPSMDPMSGSNGSLYYYQNGRWLTRNNIPRGTHVFDLLFQDNGQTIFAGLGSNEGVAPSVALSTDGGNSYKNILFRRDGKRIEGAEFTKNGAYTSTIYGRVYNLVEYRGEVYATLWCSVYEMNQKFQGLYKYNKNEQIFDYYSQVPLDMISSSMSSSVDVIYKDRLVLARNCMYVLSEDLKSYELIPANQFTGTVSWECIVGDDLYFTTFRHEDTSDPKSPYITRLYKTSDLKTCELLATIKFDAYVRSFCYYDGVFYLGTESERTATNTSTATGTVFALKLQKQNCTHTNTDTKIEENWIHHRCIDCGTIVSSNPCPHTHTETTPENGILITRCLDCGATTARVACEHKTTVNSAKDGNLITSCKVCGTVLESVKCTHPQTEQTTQLGTLIVTCKVCSLVVSSTRCPHPTTESKFENDILTVTCTQCGKVVSSGKCTHIHKEKKFADEVLTVTCTDCGAVVSSGPCPHAETETEIDGSVISVTCLDCGAVILMQDCDHEHTERTVKDNIITIVCTDCGVVLSTEVCKHENTERTVENGVFITTCTDCGTIIATEECAHENTERTVEDGVFTTTCTDCGMVIETEECAHENTERTVVLATQEEPGKLTVRCTDCASVLTDLLFPFADLNDAWYLDTIVQAYNRNLMSGTSPTEFAPDMTTRRAMLVQVLYNLEGKPATDDLANPFDDVNQDNYFYDAVKWAYANGIVTGKSDTSFAPEDDLTREQFATILYRYAQYKGADVSNVGDLSAFTDTDQIGSWALDAIAWANGQGIITGIGDTIAPQGSATRAQMATMIIRYLG